MSVSLDPASVDAVARRVAELLRGEIQAGELIDANEVAQRFDVSRDFVYRHGSELGAIRLGSGDKARLRFDPAVITDWLASHDAKSPEPAKPRRHRARREASGAELLPIKETR